MPPKHQSTVALVGTPRQMPFSEKLFRDFIFNHKNIILSIKTKKMKKALPSAHN